jgi:uncharacterized protein RhaS with RHS repeats
LERIKEKIKVSATTYTYDSAGRRISKTVGSETTKYVYDGDQIIAEYDGSGTLIREYVYGPGIDNPVKMTAFGSSVDFTDLNGDGTTDGADLELLAEAWLVESGGGGFNPDADFNNDERINNADIDIMSANWLVSSDAGDKHYYYHYDGLGSIIALTDMDGQIVETYEYDVAGSTVVRDKFGVQLQNTAVGNLYLLDCFRKNNWRL